MKFEEFQHLARLHIVGALEEEERAHFEEGLELYGELAEHYVDECQWLESALALSLNPSRPRHDAKTRLLTAIQAQGRN